MNRIQRAAAAAALGLLAMSLAGLSGSAAARPAPQTQVVPETFPAASNGRIVYTFEGLRTVNPDGSGERKLSISSSINPSLGKPDWSPDGSRIAASDNYGVIYTFNADGSKLVKLTPPGVDRANRPVWSPDGRQILYQASVPGRTLCCSFYVMNADGSNNRVLSVTGISFSTGINTGYLSNEITNPTWTPDGSTIVFSGGGDKYGSSTSFRVMRVSANGGTATEVVPGDRGEVDVEPDVSPDGSKIAFARKGKGIEDKGIWVMNSNGTAVVQLVARGTAPSWSPDGRKIAFCGVSGTGPQPGWDVFSMNADGSGVTRITQFPIRESHNGIGCDPDWGMAPLSSGTPTTPPKPSTPKPSTPGTPTKPGAADTVAPKVKALKSGGKAGTKVRLRYKVSDNSGKTSDMIVVYQGPPAKKVWSINLKLSTSSAAKTYYVSWPSPRGLRGQTLFFCVVANDAAGNISEASCAPVTLW